MSTAQPPGTPREAPPAGPRGSPVKRGGPRCSGAASLTVICFSGMKSALCLTRSKILARWGLMKASSGRHGRSQGAEGGPLRRSTGRKQQSPGRAAPRDAPSSHTPGPQLRDEAQAQRHTAGPARVLLHPNGLFPPGAQVDKVPEGTRDTSVHTPGALWPATTSGDPHRPPRPLPPGRWATRIARGPDLRQRGQRAPWL